jgi:hypothetical protein
MRPAGTPDELERRRLRAVALLTHGHPPVEVARMVGANRRSRLPEERSPGAGGAARFRATAQTARPPDPPIGAGTAAWREGGRIRHRPVDLPSGGTVDRATFPRPLSRGPYWSLAPLAWLEPAKACPAGCRAR